jgi:hypothetical protein
MKHAAIQDNITIRRCKFYTKNVIDMMIAADFRPLSTDPKECYGGLVVSHLVSYFQIHSMLLKLSLSCFFVANKVLI